MIASSSLTPDAVVCVRLTPTLSLFYELTLGSVTGVFGGGTKSMEQSSRHIAKTEH